MKKKKPLMAKPPEFPALIALKRAAKKAVELARRTGTSAYILEGGKIVDAAQKKRRKRKA